MKCPKKKFTPEEDATLLKLVKKIGPCKWNTIALSMPGRKGRQCRDRYMNYLSPNVKLDEWTADEDRLLIEKVKKYGTRWSSISKFFNGRTGSALKNRWNYRLSRSLKAFEMEEEVNLKSLDESDANNQNEKMIYQESDQDTATSESTDIINYIFKDIKSDMEFELLFAEENNVFYKNSFPIL